MGGKTSTSTSQVQIPPEVLARYNSVNATAQNVAQTPFQQYSTNPSAFVAPITPTQTAGIENTNAAAGMAQPYFQAGTGFALAGSQPVNAQPLDIGKYMNPYLQTVLGSTEALVNQQNQQAMAGQTGSAINQGYFGGDRSGIASAVLQGQQELAGGQLYSGIASDAFQQALQAAAQQQGVGLGAAQANRQALQQTGQTLAELGTGAQGAALTGAQAQLGAGQVEQQTEQAGKTALYNQFLQQQSYPFQTAQFLANIAEGTGALSGNTTTSTQPGGLFSDERLKEDMAPIGKGFDGANIYRFRYRGDPTTRIGMSAQEVERKHPEAVSEHGGFKAVDYGAATDDAARTGFALAANDNEGEERRARQAGGMSGWGMYPPGVNPMSLGELLQAQEQMYGPGFGGAGLYGGSASGMPHGGSSYVPPPMQGQPMMLHGTQPPMPQRTTAADALHSAAGMASDATGLRDDAHMAHQAYDWLKSATGPHYAAPGAEVLDPSAPPQVSGIDVDQHPDLTDGAARGGRMGFARAARQDGGGLDPSDPQNDNPYQAHGPGLNIPTAETQHPQLQAAKPPGQSGQSGLMSALGAGADIASIAKAAPEIGSMAAGIGSGMAGFGSTLMSMLPFLALARGGRAGYAAGGDAVEEALAGAKPSGDDPVENMLLSRFEQQQADDDAPGFAAADTGKPAAGAPADGPGAPPAGFAGAKPPGAPAAAKPAGFAGAAPAGLPAGFAGIYKAEGTGKNPASTAVGPGQFLRSTFIRVAKKVFPDLAGLSDDAIGALHGTAKGNEMQAQMIPALDTENAEALTKAGFEATPTNRHLAWVLGAGGARKVLSADPSTPLINLVGQQAVGANARIMAGKTAGEFINWAAKGMNKGGRVGFQRGGDPRLDPSQMEDAEPNPTPEEFAARDWKNAGFDPAVVDQAHANREAAKAGQPSTPAAQAAVSGDDAPAAVSARAPPPPPPGNSAAAAAPVPTSAAGDGMAGVPVHDAGFLPADQTGGAGAPTLNDTVNAGLKYGEQASAQATQQAQRVIGGQEASKPFWKNPDFLIPAATGLADMLAAPTKYPLVALTQGLKGGAQAYQGMRSYDATQALSEQERAALGLGETTHAFAGQTGRMQTQQQMFQNAMSFMRTRFTPVLQTGPDGLPGYKDTKTGQFVSATDYGRTMQEVMGGTIAGIRGGDPVAGLTAATQDVQPAPASESAPNGIDRSNAANLPPAGGNRPDGAGPPPAPDGSVAASSPGAGPPPAPTIHRQGTGAPTAAPSASQTGTPGVHALTYPPGSFGARVTGGEFRQPANTMPPVDPSILTDTTNPDLLYNQGMALKNMGDPQQAAAGEKMVEQANRYRDGTDLPVVKATNQPYMGYRNLKNTSDQRATIEANYGRERTQEDAAANNWENDQREQGQVLNHLIKGYQDIDTGELSGEFTKIVSAANSIPWLRDRLSPELKHYMSAVGEADKQTARLQYMQAAASALGAHAPATTLGVMGRAAPDITKGAGARYDLTAQLVGLRNQSRAYYRDWPRFKNQVDDVSAYKHGWFQAHPLQNYEDDAYARIPHFAGMTDAEKAAHAWHPKTAAEAAKVPKGTAYYKPGTNEVWEN